MPDIKLLDKSIAELIAAGEVIEKPASVIKELAENSIDAGAKHITIEIKHGGISYMRITDDGCGIAFDQLPVAFLRHATSKIRTGDDLFSIGTMGFRGEALASVAAVARVEMLSRRHEDELGGRYVIEGGEEKAHEQCGCPVGTTVIIRDLFFNTPARLKFLKKDVSEGNYISAAADRLALSNPQISFRFIRDNKSVRVTAGDGSLKGTVKAVYGRQLADSLVPVDYSLNGIEVKGLVSSPLFCRASRSMQTFFVNSRYIRSTTCMAAVEEGYRNSIMTGKFPACVLNITLAADNVDVNVHPAKTEVKFAHEKPVFDAVYLAVKNALLNCANDRRQIELENRAQKKYTSAESYFSANPETVSVEQQSLTAVTESKPVEEKNDGIGIQTVYSSHMQKTAVLNSPRPEYCVKKSDTHNRAVQVTAEADEIIFGQAENTVLPEKNERKAPENISADIAEVIPSEPPIDTKSEFKYINPVKTAVPRVKTIVPEQPEKEKEIRVIGEFAATYIICEAEDELIIIDKHAAHERIRFEMLKENFRDTSQLLVDKTEIRLSAEEYNALNEYYEYVEQAGVELIFGDDCTVSVTAVPTVIKCTPQELISGIADRLLKHSAEQTGALYDDILHTMACKSAVKANDRTDITELQALARRVFNDEKIRFCPHGRPVMTALGKNRIERFFNRS